MIIFRLCGVMCLSVIIVACSDSKNLDKDMPKTYFVDPKIGNDSNTGAIDAPFLTIDQALQKVSDRVEQGVCSDKIYLRGGVYKKVDIQTLYQLNLKGTPNDYAVLSAMPTKPNTPGAVQRKSGKWYEKVVIDDAWEIKTKWERVPMVVNIWQTNPIFETNEWNNETNLRPWVKAGFIVTDNDETPLTTAFTVAPYMLLQDGEPTVWVQDVSGITEPGMRTYNHSTGMLYLRPFSEKDPNSCLLESWYGGRDYDGVELQHGEGRAIFDGQLEYAAICGMEFRMFTRLFEHHFQFKNEKERVYQKHVLLEDNRWSYGWIQILLDCNNVLRDEPGNHLVLYGDRSHWTARNNVYYRPSREVFQLHGDGHIFEYNEVIEHNGPWAGPAACVSVLNTRNTRNAIIRYNYIYGHGNTQWNKGSVFMIETSEDHGNKNGEYLFGGQVYEYNIIVNTKGGSAMVLGKGGCRMNPIIVRNNIFVNNEKEAAILIGGPQKNLIIENNVFYNQARAIQFYKSRLATKKTAYAVMPSSIYIRNNIFMNNKQLFNEEILSPADNSILVIDNNVFYNNNSPPTGTHYKTENPLFKNPDNFDFRLKPDSPIRKGDLNIGAYKTDDYMPETDWWNIAVKMTKIQE